MSESVNIRELNELVASKNDFVQLVTRGMDQTIVGQKHLVDSLLIALLSNGHVLLEGVPGLAKTLAIKTLAQVIDAKYSRIQFTPDLLPADVIGTMIYSIQKEQFQIKKGPIFANFVLADEINRAPAKVQSALLQAMQERQVTIGDSTFPLDEPFLVMATQNPIGSAGTQNLPNSQLDRFLMKLSMGYPDVGSQVRILRERSQQEPLEQVETVMRREELLTAIARVRQVHVDDQIYDYIARLAEVTRTHPLLKLGISPRGALALCRTAKARAFAEGRDFVVPEDVTQMAEYVFAHRLMLSSKARLNEYTPEAIVAEVLAQTQPPVLSERRA